MLRSPPPYEQQEPEKSIYPHKSLKDLCISQAIVAGRKKHCSERQVILWGESCLSLHPFVSREFADVWQTALALPRARIYLVSCRKRWQKWHWQYLSSPCKAWVGRQKCWEGLAILTSCWQSQGASPVLQTPQGCHQSPPRLPPPQEAVGLASEAITSGAILGLLPNHLEYLIRGKLRCPEQFWFPIPHSRARVNPKLPSREKRRWQTLSGFNPAHSFEDKNFTNKQPQPLLAGHPPLKYCHLTCLSLPETRELIKTLCLIKKQWSIKANRTASHLLLQFCLHKLQLVCKQGHWWEIGNAPFPGHCLLPHPSFIQLFERGSAKARWGFTRLQSCTQMANSELESAN